MKLERDKKATFFLHALLIRTIRIGVYGEYNGRKFNLIRLAIL